MLQDVQTKGPVPPAPRRTAAPPTPPATLLTPLDGLTALRALSGLVWTTEALRLAEAVSALACGGGPVEVPAAALRRLCEAMAPVPCTTESAAMVLVGMGTVLALAGGRADRTVLTRPLSVAEGAECLWITATGTGAQPAGGLQS